MSNWAMSKFVEIKSFLFLTYIKFEKDELFLIFTFDDDDNKRIVVYFDEYLFFKNIDEGLALETYASGDFHGNDSQIFSANNSELVDWFNKESCGEFQDKFQHYVIPSQEDITVVLAKSPPKISKPFSGDYLNISLKDKAIFSYSDKDNF